jgi:hypothetical protein
MEVLVDNGVLFLIRAGASGKLVAAISRGSEKSECPSTLIDLTDILYI